MTDTETWGFLCWPVRPGVLSTVRADGRPHAAPIWYEVDEGTIVFTTGTSTVKGKNLARDRRVTLCVQDDKPPFAFVVVEGEAEICDDVDEVGRWAARIGGRYMGVDRAQEYGARNGVPGEVLVRITPTRLTAAKDVAD